MKREKLIRKREHIQQLLELLIQICFFFSISVFIVVAVTKYASSTFIVISGGLVISAVIIFYLIRHRKLHFVAAVLVHIIFVVVGVFPGEHWDEKLLLPACLAALSVYSIRKIVLKRLESTADQSAKQTECLPWQCACIILFCYFITNNRLYPLHLFMYVMFVLFCLFYLINYFMSDVNQLMISHKNDQVFPLRQIISVNNFKIVAFTVAVVIIAGAFFNGPFGSLNHMIWSGFVLFLFFLLSLLNGVGSAFIPNMVPMEMPTETFSTEDETMTTPTQSLSSVDIGGSRTFEIMAFILMAVIVIVVICLIVYGIIHLWKAFRNAKNNDYDHYETYYGDTKSKEPVYYERNDPGQNSEQDHNQAIRKMYRKSVLSGLKNKTKKNVVPAVNELPEQLTEHIVADQERTSEAITDIYEKARYSDRELTEQDVKKMQNTLKNK